MVFFDITGSGSTVKRDGNGLRYCLAVAFLTSRIKPLLDDHP